MLLGLVLILAQTPAPAAATEAFRFDYFRVKDRIEADGHARRTVEVSVLLRTPAAVQQFGQLSVPYVDGYADVSFERIRLQKPSGAMSDVQDGQLEDLNPFGINAASIPVDIRLKKLTIPRLEPGDRLSYTLITSFRPFVPGEAYGEMKFTPVPVDGPQVYDLDIPAQSRLRVNVRADLGASWEQLPSDKDRLLRRLTVSVPPLVVPSGGLTEAQLEGLQIPDVAYTTFASWSEVGEWWWDMSRLQVRGDAATRAEALRLTAGKTTPREKIEAIATFVSSNIRYLNVSFGIGRMQPRTAGSVLSSRYGDCKDKVGLVMALADAVGIEVRPVLIHTARHDLQDDTPGPHQFDHMIAAAILGPAEKDWLWIDATNSLSPPTTLFPPARDKRGLAIDAKGHGIVVRTPARPGEATHRLIDLKGTLDPAGLLKGHVRMEDRSDREPNLRAAFASAAPEQHAELMKSILARTWSEARISSVRVGDPADIARPLALEFDFERDIKGVDSEKEWKLWVPDLGPVLLEAPTDPTVRKPVRFDVDEVTFKAQVTLPDGVTARGPLSISMERPFARLDSKYSVDGQTLRVERVFHFPQPAIDRDQLPAYEALRKAASTDREQEFAIGPVRAAAPAAASLQKEGNSAYGRKDYEKAIELLQKAIAADPELPAAHYDLGMAFRESRKYEEAIGEFSRAIEADPFHNDAYAERAYCLLQVDRDAEAEKDLLKQIEVAPFKAWSYQELARQRVSQRRYAEAADLWSKSLAIDASDVDGWVALGWARARNKQAAEAGQAFAKAESMGLQDGQSVALGLGYAYIGDTVSAGRMAEKDLPGLEAIVGRITAENAEESFLYWSRRLSEAWLLIGEAALAKDDGPKADRYLRAAWETGLLSNAGYSLGRLRHKQGKDEETAVLWSAAADFDSWSQKPEDFDEALATLRRQGFATEGSSERARLRILVVPGPPTLEVKQDLLILISGGKVEAVKALSEKQDKDWASVGSSLVGLKAVAPGPDGQPAKVLRRGRLLCQLRVGCSVLFGVAPRPIGSTDPGSVELVSITPAGGSELKAGADVSATLDVRYALEGTDPGDLVVTVADESRVPLVLPRPMKKVNPGKGEAHFTFHFTAPAAGKRVFIFAGLLVRGKLSDPFVTSQYPVK